MSQAFDDGLVAAMVPVDARVLRSGRAHPGLLGILLCLFAALTIVAGGLAWMAFAPNAVPDLSRAISSGGADPSRSPPVDPQAPPVDPVRYLNVSRESAREMNAAVPFATRANPPAAPFAATVPAGDAARAVDCLAAVAWYEAGDDGVGQQAVVQVVLNRVRHKSFASTICGVVFQGAERRTGCQFTFTCDGALIRTPSAAAWIRARGIAIAALNGFVFAPVGWSTHYHTDWVVPYWSSSVDKTAMVHTHLFFRWKGVAGDAGAFGKHYAGNEPAVPALGRLSSAHLITADDATTDTPTLAVAVVPQPEPPGAVPPVPETLLRGGSLAARDVAANAYSIQVAPDAFAGNLAMAALDLCRQQPGAPCSVFASTKGAIPIGGSGRPADLAQVDFYYFHDAARGRERVLWNCSLWKRASASQCLGSDFKPD